MFKGLYYLPTGAVVRRIGNTTHGIFTLTKIETVRCDKHNPQLIFTQNEYLRDGAGQLAAVMANLCTHDVFGLASDAEIASWKTRLNELENVVLRPEYDAEYALFRVTNPSIIAGTVDHIIEKVGSGYVFQEAAKYKSHQFALRYNEE